MYYPLSLIIKGILYTSTEQQDKDQPLRFSSEDWKKIPDEDNKAINRLPTSRTLRFLSLQVCANMRKVYMKRELITIHYTITLWVNDEELSKKFVEIGKDIYIFKWHKQSTNKRFLQNYYYK